MNDNINPTNANYSDINEFKKNLRKASSHNSAMLLLFLAISLILSYAIQIICSNILNLEEETSNKIVFITGTLAQFVIAAPLILIIAGASAEGKKRTKITSLFCKPQVSYKQIGKWILISFFIGRATVVVSAYFFKLIQMIVGKDFTAVDFSSNGTAYNTIFNIVAMIILAPIFEELIFRGILANNSSRFGNLSAMITSGIFFGLYHLNYEQVIYAAVLGMCSAFILIKSRSIIPCILMHMFFNFFGSITSLFPSEALTNIQKMDMQYISDHPLICLGLMLVSMATVAVMMIGLVVMIIEIQKNKESFRIDKIHTELSEGRKVAEYFKAPLTIVLTLILIGLTVLNASR